MIPLSASFHQALIFDHAGIGQEFLEVDPHAGRIRRIGRAEIDQENADAFRRNAGRELD